MSSRDGDGQDRRAERDGQAEGPGLEAADAAIERARALGKDHHRFARPQQARRLARRPRIARFELDGKGSRRRIIQLNPGTSTADSTPVVDRPTHGDRDEDGIGERLMVGTITTAPTWGCVPSPRDEAEVQPATRCTLA